MESRGQKVIEDGATAAAAVGSTRTVQWGARLGFAVSGVLHLLIAWIALKLAWSARGAGQGAADQSGALATMASSPGGTLLLLLAALGLALLAVWQVTDAFARDRESVDRAKAAGKAVLYGTMAGSALKVALGGSSSSGADTRSLTASLLSATGGRWLVALLGLAVIGAGGYHVYKGWTKGFLKDLGRHPGTVAVRLGQIGYAAKGVAIAVAGGLFLAAAWHARSHESTGLDGALRTLREQPYGPYLLTVVALGLAAFGGFSLAKARAARLG